MQHKVRVAVRRCKREDSKDEAFRRVTEYEAGLMTFRAPENTNDGVMVQGA
jgi:hypothetical protein